MSHPTLCFTPKATLTATGNSARCASVSIARHNSEITIQTPGLLSCTSRGVIPHLARDNVARTDIKWVHVPFETFLEHNPPVPTLQPGDTPLHSFLGLPAKDYLLSMSLRDPADGREMPANTNPYVTANCIRGVRKVTPNNWRSYVHTCKPDIVFALSDTPFTPPPYSQKRLTKSIERSAAWLADILHSDPNSSQPPPLNVFVHMAGGASHAARSAFAKSLVETLYGKDAEAVQPLKCLDEGVAGYSFDMVPLKLALQVSPSTSVPLPLPSKVADSTEIFDSHSSAPYVSTLTQNIAHLLRTSLAPLPPTKPRLVTTAQGPHEILLLILDAGIDLFDTHWAQRAADIGVALNFIFPAPTSEVTTENQTDENEGQESQRKRDLGHNLYDVKYRRDFKPLADSFIGGSEAQDGSSRVTCTCAACSPVRPQSRISHSIVDGQVDGSDAQKKAYRPSYTRAYLHHLLHTHEMSAHSLLVMHNLAVMESFFAGVRGVIMREAEAQAGVTHSTEGDGDDDDKVIKGFAVEVERFCRYYDGEEMRVFKEAKSFYEEVERLRGKGRLAREKEKEEQEILERARKEMAEKGVEGGETLVVADVVDDGTSLGTKVEV